MDKAFISEIMNIFSKSNINKLKIIHDNFQIELEKEALKSSSIEKNIFENKQSDALSLYAIPEETHKTKKIEKDIEIIKSPIVGTYYSSPDTGLKPFVEVGTSVSKGQILCIIEAMKVMNEIKAPCSGVIDEIYVTNGDIVEYDSPIMSIRK